MTNKVYLFTEIDNKYGDNTYEALTCTSVLNENGLRKEFNRLREQNQIPLELFIDYIKDPDYIKENWDDLGNLSIGTMIDIINDICNYNPMDYFLVQEKDLILD